MLVPVDKPTYFRGWLRLSSRPVPPDTVTIINSWIVGDADRTSCEKGIQKWDDAQMVDDTTIIVTIAATSEGAPESLIVSRDELAEAFHTAMNAMSEHSTGCKACTTATDAASLCPDGFKRLTTVFKLRGLLDQAEDPSSSAGSAANPSSSAGSAANPSSSAGSAANPSSSADKP